VHFLDTGRILASGSLDSVRRSERPEIRNFFGD
jgi:hypothetical protein